MTLEQWIQQQIKQANGRGYRAGAMPGRKRSRPFDPNFKRRVAKKAKRAA